MSTGRPEPEEAEQDDDEAEEAPPVTTAAPARDPRRPSRTPLVIGSVLAAVGSLAMLLFFANRDDSARNDALLFLDRYEGIDVDDPVEDRRTRIDTLAALPIGSEEVDHVRDLCVDAHRTLIRAEDSGTAARVAYQRATEGRVAEEDIPTDVRATIESSLAESNGALEIARDAMPRCLSAVRGLELRFQPQRARH